MAKYLNMKTTVEAQTGLFGTVGGGKSNALHKLLGTVRARNGSVRIFDRMGALVPFGPKAGKNGGEVTE